MTSPFLKKLRISHKIHHLGVLIYSWVLFSKTRSLFPEFTMYLTSDLSVWVFMAYYKDKPILYWSINIFLHSAFWIYTIISVFTSKVNTTLVQVPFLPSLGNGVSHTQPSLSIWESRWWRGSKSRKDQKCLEELILGVWGVLSPIRFGSNISHGTQKCWGLSAAGVIGWLNKRAKETPGRPGRAHPQDAQPPAVRGWALAAVRWDAGKTPEPRKRPMAGQGSAPGINEVEHPEQRKQLRTYFLKKWTCKVRSQKKVGPKNKKIKKKERKWQLGEVISMLISWTAVIISQYLHTRISNH